MDKIIWINGTTKLNKATMDRFQDNIEAGIEEIRDYVEEVIGVETDTFSTSSTYDIDDIVIYENKLYKCTTAVTTAGNFDNNDWTEISIKSLIDGANSKITELNNKVTNIGTYSTAEIVVGTWLGKPLYRKVIQLQSSDFGTGTATAPTGVNITHNISNVDYMVNWSGRWKRTSTGEFRDFPNSSPSNDAWHGHLIPTATNLFFELGSVLVNNLRSDSELIYVVLEYTKTTDT